MVSFKIIKIDIRMIYDLGKNSISCRGRYYLCVKKIAAYKDGFYTVIVSI